MIWLDKLGFPPANEEETVAILQEVKSTSLRKKGLLTEEDFGKIAEGVVGSRTALR